MKKGRNKKANSHFDFAINNILPKSKHSQITLILILAIVIVSLLIIFFVFRTKFIPKPEEKIPEINNIDNILQDCIRQRTIDAVYLIGLQGGYTRTPEKNVKIGSFNVAYGLHNNKNTLASLSKIESEISDYIKLTIPFCINEQDFLQLNIRQEKPEVNAKINQNSIKISAKPRLSITKNNKIVELNKNYDIEIPIRLGKIHLTANSIIQKHLEDPEFIDLTYLTSLDFYVTFSHYTETTLVYTITDEESEIENIPYSFMFAVEGR